jgi:hypothetical protein
MTVYDSQNPWGYGLCLSSGIKKLEHGISETGVFPSSGERRKTTLLGRIERANLNHWTTPSYNKGYINT